MNTSVQSLISTILEGVAEATKDQTDGNLRTMRERFFYVAQAHGVDMPTIVSLMQDHGFTLSALASNDRLLDLLRKPAIEHWAALFCVRPEWLCAMSDSAVQTGIANVQWYKNVPSMAHALVRHVADGLKPKVIVLRRQRADFDAAAASNDDASSTVEPVGIVLRLERTAADGTSFAVYQRWEFERWNYWRCREQMKLMIAFCDQMRGQVSIVGHELSMEKIDALLKGEQLPVTLLSRLGSVSWHPDDYVGVKDSVQREAHEWPGIDKAYRTSPLPAIAEAAGAAPLRPAVPTEAREPA